MRLATRALKALRASSVPLRPRCARLTALTARAATRSDGNYRRPTRKCLTTVGSGATVGSSSLAATRGPLHIDRCGARSNRRSQATVRSPLLKPLPGRLFVRRHVRETDNRIGLRFGPRPGADPTRAPHRPIITLPRRYACQKSMRREMRSARPFTVNNERHRRSEWAGVSWPKDDATNGTRPAALGSRSCEGQRTQAPTAQTRRFARSFAPWRGRPHASASSWN